MDALEAMRREVHQRSGLEERPVAQRDALFDALASLVQDRALADHVRAAAIDALRGFFDRRALRVFARVLADRGASIVVRAECAEAMGYCAERWFDRARTRDAELSRAVSDALDAGLRDPSPAVRFWSVYAVGMLRARAFESHVTTVASRDDAAIEGFWSIADEARDVAAVLRGEPWPERVAKSADASDEDTK